MAVSSTKHEKQSGVLVFDFVLHRLPDHLKDATGSRESVTSISQGDASSKPSPPSDTWGDRLFGRRGGTRTP